MQLVMHLHGISVKGFIPGFWDAIISSSPLNIAWPANNLGICFGTPPLLQTQKGNYV
jgi:hypothetical protein